MVNALLACTVLAGAVLSAPTPQGGPPFPPPPANSTFYISPKVINGNEALNGRYLSYFHTGAGEATLVTTTNKTEALKFFLNDSKLATYTRSDVPPPEVGFVDQHPYMSSAPDNYNLLTFDYGTGDAGFAEVHVAGPNEFYVGFAGNVPGFKAFALCEVNGTSPYESLGPQVQLLWEKEGAMPDAKCAEVGLLVESCA